MKQVFVFKTEADPQTEDTGLWFPKGKGEERDELRVWDWYIHTTICKQMINKDLLESTGNSTQYSVITYNGKSV